MQEYLDEKKSDKNEDLSDAAENSTDEDYDECESSQFSTPSRSRENSISSPSTTGPERDQPTVDDKVSKEMTSSTISAEKSVLSCQLEDTPTEQELIDVNIEKYGPHQHLVPQTPIGPSNDSKRANSPTVQEEPKRHSETQENEELPHTPRPPQTPRPLKIRTPKLRSLSDTPEVVEECKSASEKENHKVLADTFHSADVREETEQPPKLLSVAVATAENIKNTQPLSHS